MKQIFIIVFEHLNIPRIVEYLFEPYHADTHTRTHTSIPTLWTDAVLRNQYDTNILE